MQRRPEFSFPGSPVRGLDRALPPRPPVNMVPPRPGEEEEEIRWLQASRQGSPDYHSSGTPSPPLWAHHNHEHQPYPASAGSSPSRAQVIATYRREMLDLVRGLPESAYELSLRDIVEHRLSTSPASTPLPTPPSPPPLTNADAALTRDHGPANTAAVDEQGAKQSGATSKKQGRKQRAVRRQRSRSMERSVSLDTGLLIKFFLPFSIGRGGKKKVSPKLDAAAKDGKKKKKKQGTKKREEARQDEEWWTKNEFSEAVSSSRTSSSSSSSNSCTGSVRNGGGNGGGSNPRAPPVRSRSRKRNGCYAFFRTIKSKNGASQD